jgi:hypothetical protein
LQNQGSHKFTMPKHFLKNLIPLALLIGSFKSYSQNIIENETDKLTKQHMVRTDSLLLKGGFSTNIFIEFRAVDTTCFLIVSGNGKGADLIADKEEIIFFLDNDSTVSAYSTGIQYYKESGVSSNSSSHQYHSTDIQDYHIESGDPGNSYRHQYLISINAIKALSHSKLRLIRKYGSKHYNDFDIRAKNSKRLSNLCKIFLAAIGVN